MFSSSSNGKDTQKSSKNGPALNTAVNIIGQTTIIKGEVTAEGDIRVDGKITGTITSKAKVVIGSTGNIKGDIICENADISGKVAGKVEVKSLLFLKNSANLEGSVVTNKIVIEEGASFNGDCIMGAKAPHEYKPPKQETPVKKETA